MTGNTAKNTLQQIEDAYRSASDLDFELQVRSLLEGAGIEVDHGGRYLDPVTQKIREYDILAKPKKKTLYGGETAPSFFDLRLVIECKNINPEFPIVVGLRESSGEPVLGMRIYRTDKISAELHHHSLNWEKMVKLSSSLGNHFTQEIGVEVIQVSIPQGGTSNQKSPDRAALFDKWSQALHHAIVVSRRMIRGIAQREFGDMHIWVPAILVVPNERLFMARRDAGMLQIAPAEAVRVKVNHEFEVEGVRGSQAVISNYFIMTPLGLSRFLSQFG